MTIFFISDRVLLAGCSGDSWRRESRRRPLIFPVGFPIFALLSSPAPLLTSLFPAYIPFTWATGRHLQGHHPHPTPNPRLFQASFRASKCPENDDLVVSSKCLSCAPSTGRV